MTKDDWVAAMRANPTCTLTMMVCADWLDEEGRPHAAEAMRMLGEHGKIGHERRGYEMIGAEENQSFTVCREWWEVVMDGKGMEPWYCRREQERFRLAEAYEAADEDTRLRWAMATFGLQGVCR
jgi:uncharacterized protein (TIGR02996 family)